MREIIFICLLLLYGACSVVLADSVTATDGDSLVCLYTRQIYKKSNPDKVKLVPVYAVSKENLPGRDTLKLARQFVSRNSPLHPSVYAASNALQGVYMIVNDVTGKVFICSSTNIPSSVLAQKTSLNNKTCSSKALQEAWSRYGELSFSYVLLEQVAGSEIQLLQRETYWINHYKSYQQQAGYSFSPL